MSQLDFVRVKEPERIAELAIFAEDIFREYFSTLHGPEKVDYLVNHLLSIETLTTAIADRGLRILLRPMVGIRQSTSGSSASGPMTAFYISASSISSRMPAARGWGVRNSSS